MTTTRSPQIIATTLLVSAILAGCGSSQTTAEVRGKTAAERPKRVYSGASACATTGTEVLLAAQAGSPADQAVCGLLTTDPSGGPLYLYRGIPYADPPIGAYRWTDPRPPTYQEVPATEFGPRCPQGSAKALQLLETDVNEDCLYLNVWTPQVTPQGTGDLPVMVFIHGGAFIIGSGGWARGVQPGHLNDYDGAQMVATSRSPGPPVVFVTMNYRLGVLGFLAGDTIGLDGNYGMKDQTAALQWVQRNISRFGGDPSKVMIFGESAGAQSTALHLAIQQDGHQDLFARAAMESNYAITYQTVAEAQGKADAFALRTACDEAGSPAEVLACLRQLPLSSVLEGQISAYDPKDTLCNGLQTLIPWQPVIDGSFITHDPIDGPITKPVMLGSNLNESIPFVVPMISDNATLAALEYPALIGFLFGTDRALEIHTKYEVSYPHLAPLQKMEQVVTDYLWTCFNRALGDVPARSGQPVWRYHNVHHGSFSVWANPTLETQSPVAIACSTAPAVCHADELPYVFGNPADAATILQSFTPDEVSFSLALRNYWIQFARNGNPNVPGQTAWPTHSSGFVLKLQAPGTAITSIAGAEIAVPANCDLIWDRVGYKVKSAYADRPECTGAAP